MIRQFAQEMLQRHIYLHICQFKCLIQFPSSVVEHINRALDLVAHGKVNPGNQDCFSIVGFGQPFAPRVDDGGVSAQRHPVREGAAAVDRDEKDLILDGAGLRERPPMGDARRRPRRGQEDQRRVLQRVTPEKLRKAQVVADSYGALHAVEGKDRAVIALAEEFILLRRGEKVRLVVIGDKLAVPIKDIAAVRDIIAGFHGDGAADKVDAVLFRQGRK